jgi:oxygen-independent coproporphyrinogen III oxidase
MLAAEKGSFSLYVHIPYCVSKCPYCDFNSHVVPVIPEEAYTRTLITELDYYHTTGPWAQRTVQSIFFGGGTPSTFHPASIDRILNRIATTFHLDPKSEITLEANPGTVDRSYFSGYRAGGVNRISVGIQSFQPRLLKFLGRVHSADEAKKALGVVREVGFENFGLDLIYANPGQTLEELSADLEMALSFGSPHLSAYNLTIEEGTPFHHEYRIGRLKLLNEDEEIAMAELIESKVTSAGLQRYEISNYARSGLHSRHNVNYWQSGDYLGVGAGAHSYRASSGSKVLGHRWSNEKNPARYMSMINDLGQAVTERDEIDGAEAVGEFMFLGLRMTAGISSETFCCRFGKRPVDFYPQIATWIESDLMEEKSGHLRLTRKGLSVANSIFVHFV